MDAAILREKRLKKWNRARKLRLIGGHEPRAGRSASTSPGRRSMDGPGGYRATTRRPPPCRDGEFRAPPRAGDVRRRGRGSNWRHPRAEAGTQCTERQGATSPCNSASCGHRDDEHTRQKSKRAAKRSTANGPRAGAPAAAVSDNGNSDALHDRPRADFEKISAARRGLLHLSAEMKRMFREFDRAGALSAECAAAADHREIRQAAWLMGCDMGPSQIPTATLAQTSSPTFPGCATLPRSRAVRSRDCRTTSFRSCPRSVC